MFDKVLGINGLLSYEGKTGNLLEQDFMAAVDPYLSDCKRDNINPDKPFKGNFNVRVSPQLHQKAVLLAMEDQTS
ncbi:MAG: type II toxin-antitoxin system HicB family antitoxin [Prolixibacteraceae bacterium]